MAVAATTTQATLKANIDGYLHRTFTSGELDQFVDLASARLGRDLRSREQERTATLWRSGAYALLPKRCQEIRAVYRIEGPQLQSFGYAAGQAGSSLGRELLYRLGPSTVAGQSYLQVWPYLNDEYLFAAATPITIAGVTASSTIALVNAPAHGFANGTWIEIRDATNTEWNGTYNIELSDANYFYIRPAAGFASTMGGTPLAYQSQLLVRYVEGPDPDFLPAGASGDTNPVLLAHPEVYLYACLAEAASYIHDLEHFQQYSALYSAEVAQINRQHRNLRWGAAPAATSNINMRGRPASGL